jgi:hypothetical protein
VHLKSLICYENIRKTELNKKCMQKNLKKPCLVTRRTRCAEVLLWRQAVLVVVYGRDLQQQGLAQAVAGTGRGWAWAVGERMQWVGGQWAQTGAGQGQEAGRGRARAVGEH